jgi:HlyD family secretion protein
MKYSNKSFKYSIQRIMGHKPGIKDQLSSKLITRWAIILAVLGAIATGATAIYTVSFADQRQLDESSPTRPPSPAIKAVTALGRLEPEGEVIQLSASNSLQGAKVAQLLVSQGDQVREKQVIAVLDSRDRLQAALERSQKQVKVAQANLEKVRAGAKLGAIGAQEATIKRLKAELDGEKTAQQTTVTRLQTQLLEARQAQDAIIRRLEAELRSVQTDFERYQKLAQDGAIPATELDTRRLKVETAIEQLSEAQANRNQALTTLSEQLKEAEANRDKTTAVLEEQINEATATLAQIKEVRPVDIQQAEAEVESSLAAVGEAQADLELAYVRAPVAGRILKINTLAGESINEQEGIAELGQTDQMVVIAEVYESDISKVRLGQRVTVTSEGKSFEGELRGNVSQIGLRIGKKDILDTDPASAVDARVVEVNIRLNPEDSKRVSSLTNSKVIVEILL